MNKYNLTLMSDGYKILHWNMYPRGTENVYSYFEARKGARFNKTVFFGLQYLLKEYLTKRITQEDIEEAEKLVETYLGDKSYFNRKMWQRILDVHGGKLPLRIRAVPEGTPVDIDNVLMTVENTDPECAALTNHFETILTHVWGPSTVATLSREIKILIKHYLEQTSDVVDEHLNFALHDFGYRGVNQNEAAGICGAAHLINFLGTDTIQAMQVAKQYYNATQDGLAYSVPASEHSNMTSLGEDGEKQVFESMLDTFKNGILSVVIDSYDYRRFVNKYAKELKDKILNRNGKAVFRPDSGDPNSVTIDVLESLGNVFGYTVNSKGFKVLNEKVGVLWGDGIDYEGVRSILFTMRNSGWAANNIVFGMGGALLQKINRDTQRFAFKSCGQKRDGVWHDIQKNPLDATKKSKKGKLALIKIKDGSYKTEQMRFDAEAVNDELVTVFLNGEIKTEYNFDEIRENASL